MRSARPESLNSRSPSENLISPRISAWSAATLRAPRRFPGGEPARDPLEARPPECARLGEILDRGEMLAAKLDECADRIVRQRLRDRRP